MLNPQLKKSLLQNLQPLLDIRLQIITQPGQCQSPPISLFRLWYLTGLIERDRQSEPPERSLRPKCHQFSIDASSFQMPTEFLLQGSQKGMVFKVDADDWPGGRLQQISRRRQMTIIKQPPGISFPQLRVIRMQVQTINQLLLDLISSTGLQ